MITLRGLLRTCLRWWPMLLGGAVVTACAAYVVVSDDGVYYTRTEIAFLAPASQASPNPVRTQSDSIIVTAGAVARAVAGAAELPKFAAEDVTLVGTGVRDGWSLRLPDTGGQWASNFATQRLVLEIVGPTRADVAARQHELTEEVISTARAMQAGQGALPEDFITTTPMPDATRIFHMTGNRPRALLMTAALGMSATAACVIMLERRRAKPERAPR
ncbi:hypothetical protein [Agrococcus sp. Ld7]|uniref:hypothetical protein n=1 Tax=Agrococcus sp. Ld7 TaxID=649148 RepID=UPI0038669E33